MKTIAELEAIRKKALDTVNLRVDRQDGIRVVVGMATCGIAAGARPVLSAFLEEVAKRSVKDVIVSQTGCIGMCKYEPIVEVTIPGSEKVTYINVKPEMVPQIVSEHLINNHPCTKYTISSVE